ncbi:TauD/TfdA family dioxygenase [Prescottella sp. R16]|uniref:TauD/TfdA dioxygenase family protein n=1 Tax=Prescottella sp. R16 TaxID=3064529 RepID=UPI00272DF10C|nr:TauD/TfdA family dioxygenase [Prescottella sp. R16]
MTIEVLPVTNSIGAEVRGVDLRTCDDTTFDAVRRALHEHQVIFLRGAQLDPESHLAVARRFGTPSIFPLARLQGATEPSLQVITDGPDSPPTAEMWHTDVTWISTPPRYALLCGEIVPAAGGDTLWASMTAAYDALSPTMQEMLAGLEIEHTTDSFVDSILERGGGSSEARALADRLNDAYPRVVRHPLVRTHPENGRRILFIGGPSMDRITGMRRDESDALLGFLRNHVTDERFQCRWRWTAGDLAIWDERSTMHRAAADHFPQHRTVRRIEIDGDRPYFDRDAHPAAVGEADRAPLNA